MQQYFKFLKTWNDLKHKINAVSVINRQGEIITDKNCLPSLCVYLQNRLPAKSLCCRDYCRHLNHSLQNPAELYIFRCHAGLSNFIIPLVNQGQNLGGIIGGRVILNDGKDKDCSKTSVDEIAKLAPNDFQALINEVRPLLETIKQEVEKYAPRQLNFRLTDPQHNLAEGLQYLLFRIQQEMKPGRENQIPANLLVLKFKEKVNAVAVLKKLIRRNDVIVGYAKNILVILLSDGGEQEGLKTTGRIKKFQEKNILPENFQLGFIKLTPAHSQKEVLTKSIQNVLGLMETGNYGEPAVLPRPPLYPVKSRLRRVVITGVGIVSPVGCDKNSFASALSGGRSGIKRLTLFDPSAFPSQIGGEIHNFPLEKFIEPAKAGKIGRATAFAVGAAKMALADAGLNLHQENPQRVGVFIGSAVAGLEFGELQVYNLLKYGAEEISPYLAVNIFGGAISSETSIALSTTGYCATLSTGCAAGTDAVGSAFHFIRAGRADIILAGGADAPINPICFGSFCAIDALSTGFNHCPEKASRPFDLKRSGFVIAEGAGMVVLEELQHALRRGAYIYGEVMGFGSTNDAYHMSQSAPDGEAAAAAVRIALKDAGLETKHIDYINAHGSSTPLNDVTETRVIKEIFGRHAYRLAISSTKSITGHPIGASGALEIIACLLGIEQNFIPPTLNQEYFDPECDLDYVPNKARRAALNVVASNSFGFGGKNACIIISRY